MKKGYTEPRSSSSCAACKLLKRRCSPSCIFAPHFRADEPKKFAKVHKVFGASNVSKILNEVPEEHREDTVNSLSYEAEARLRDPVYGCIGAIALLQRRMIQLQHDLALARARLAQYKASSLHSNVTASSNTDDNGLFGLGDHNVSIIHMNLCSEGLISLDQFSQSDNGAYNSNDFGQVPDLLPL
ncbi:LOB domain-containing protein 21-like [Chenopodium quinoa]|nr:LOB domain-containing protein 21-like [Chenopodium quinoa]